MDLRKFNTMYKFPTCLSLNCFIDIAMLKFNVIHLIRVIGVSVTFLC